MAFKMKKGGSAFPYGNRPGENVGGRANIRASRKIANVEARRPDGPRIKTLFGRAWDRRNLHFKKY